MVSETGGARAARPSKTASARQARPIIRALAATGALACAAASSACHPSGGEAQDCPAEQRAHTLSGFCVPRWVSLKRGEVLGRKGPGKDYPGVFVYRARGLPVQIVAETAEWRRVCDPYGGAVWVSRSMVDGRHTVLAMGGTQAPVLEAPRPGAPAVGLLVPRALAGVKRCQDGWCEVSVGSVRGWTPASGLWGVAQTPQCR